MTDQSILTGLRRGLSCRCPSCGEGRLFAGYLAVRSPCETCGADNADYPLDDFPPYLTIVLVGHVVVPLLIWADLRFAAPIWLQFAIWLPVTLILSLLVLPRMKGATAGLCWATGITRPRHAEAGPASTVS
jgi:uncharacterized protein (DUF983 family)